MKHRTEYRIFGQGGHAKEVAWVLRRWIEADEAYRDWLTPRPLILTFVSHPYTPSLPKWADSPARTVEPGASDSLILGIGLPNAKSLVVNDAAHRNIEWIDFVASEHPGSPRKARGRYIGENAFVPFYEDALGSFVTVGASAVVSHDCAVGEFTTIGPGAVLCGGAVVGQNSFVGAGATVLPGVRVGDCAIIGAGAVVCRTVESGTTVVGVPARDREWDARRKEGLL